MSTMTRILEVCYVPDTVISTLYLPSHFCCNSERQTILLSTRKLSDRTKSRGLCWEGDSSGPCPAAPPPPLGSCAVVTPAIPPRTSPVDTCPRAQTHKTASPDLGTRWGQDVLLYHGANASTSFFRRLSECCLGVSNFHKISLIKRKDKTEKEFDGKLYSEI